jgi:hypothetical protein
VSTPLRTLYVFTARKTQLLENVQRGTAPDTLLFGFNHIHAHNVAAEFYEPAYGRTGSAVARQVGRLGPDVLQLRTLSRFSRYDVVFLTGAWPLLLAARLLPRRRRPKLVWLNMTLTNLIRRGGARARLVTAAAREADRIVCVAEFQRQFLHEGLGIPYERLPLALSGTDADFWDPAKATPTSIGPDSAESSTGGTATPIVLAAGRDAGRDYTTLASAAHGAPYVLRLVCSPRNLSGVTLPPNATVRYDVPEAMLRDEYAASNLVVVPTQGEQSIAGSDCSGTLVLLDALAMSKRCVITERASVHDYVSVPAHARTVRACDPAMLGSAIQEMLGLPASSDVPDPLAGQARVRERLTTKHFALRVADILHEAASSR